MVFSEECRQLKDINAELSPLSGQGNKLHSILRWRSHVERVLHNNPQQLLEWSDADKQKDFLYLYSDFKVYFFTLWPFLLHPLWFHSMQSDLLSPQSMLMMIRGHISNSLCRLIGILINTSSLVSCRRSLEWSKRENRKRWRLETEKVIRVRKLNNDLTRYKKMILIEA